MIFLTKLGKNQVQMVTQKNIDRESNSSQKNPGCIEENLKLHYSTMMT